jgi:TolB-like protein
LLTGSSLLAFPSYAAETAKPQKLPTLIVFNIVNERGVDKSMANLITELVLDSVTKTGKYNVMGQKDLDKMLSWEQQKQTQGCTDIGCLVQLAGSLGASYYIEGSIGAMGDMYLVSLKLIDANNVKVLQRSTEKVSKDENAVVAAVEKQVAALFGGTVPGAESVGVTGVRPTNNGPSDVGARHAVPVPANPALVKWGMGLTFSGIGVTAIGGVMTGLAYKASGDYKSEKDPKKMNDLKTSIGSYNGAAIAMYSVGGAAAVTGVVLWVLGATGKPKKTVGAADGVPSGVGARHAVPALTFAPALAPGFGGMAVGGEW